MHPTKHGSDSGATPDLGHAPPLVGRVAEMALLRQWLEGALAGRGRLALLTGEAGVGKTRLGREVLALAACRRAYALEGACYPARSAVSFGPFVAALRQGLRESPEIRLEPVWREALHPLLPELGRSASMLAASRPVAEHEDSLRFEAFYQALRALARGRGLALLIEDLQWTDRASLEQLRYVTRGLEREPILILATIREDLRPTDPPQGELLAELARLPLSEELALRPLGLEETTELLAHRLPNLDGGSLSRLAELIFDQTAGNAFFVDELASWLAEPGRADVALAEAGRPTLELPRSIRDAVAARLETAGESARCLLSWAAVLGREFDFPVLARLLGDEPAAVGSLRELVDHRLVAPMLDGDRFVFRHPIVREAVYGRLLAPERATLHRAAAEAIEAVHAADLTPHLAELAHHHLAAGDSERALQYAIRAGEWALQVQAYGDAITHFERALALLPPRGQSPRRLAVIEALARAHLRVDRIVDAVRLLRELLESHLARDDRLAAARVQTELAHACYIAGARDEGLAHCEAGLALLDGLDAPAERADLLNGRAHLRHMSGDLIGRLADSQAALVLAEQLSDDRRAAEAAVGLTYGQAMVGSPHDAEVIGRRGLRAAERLADTRLESDLLRALAFVYGGVQQELARSEALLVRALELARRIGSRRQEADAMSLLCYCVAIPRGEWARAECLARGMLAIADRLGLLEVRCGAFEFLGMLAAARGEHATARATFQRVIDEMGGQGLYAWFCRYEIGGLLLREGRVGEAIDALEATLEEQLRSVGPSWSSRLAEAYLLAGEREQARTWSARSLEASRGTGRVFDTLEAERVAALIAAVDGDLPGAVAALEATVARLIQIGRPADQARHARDLADLLSRPGLTHDPVRALALLSDAQATFSRLGARHELEVTRALARRHGLALPSPSASAVDDLEPARINARQREVAAAIGRGMANREIAEMLVISGRTVEWHVSNILAKLGLRSRTQLATWAIQHGLAAGSREDPPVRR